MNKFDKLPVSLDSGSIIDLSKSEIFCSISFVNFATELNNFTSSGNQKKNV